MACASAVAVLRLISCSSAVARAVSAVAMSAPIRVETYSSMSVTLLEISDQLAVAAALKGNGKNAHVGRLVEERDRPRRDLLLHGLPLLPSQVFFPQASMFLHLEARLLLRLVGHGLLLPLSHVGRGPLLAPFPLGEGPLLLLFLVKRGQGRLLDCPCGLRFQFGLLCARELEVHLGRKNGGERGALSEEKPGPSGGHEASCRTLSLWWATSSGSRNVRATWVGR